jgi:hypothetical protein
MGDFVMPRKFEILTCHKLTLYMSHIFGGYFHPKDLVLNLKTMTISLVSLKQKKQKDFGRQTKPGWRRLATSRQ